MPVRCTDWILPVKKRPPPSQMPCCSLSMCSAVKMEVSSFINDTQNVFMALKQFLSGVHWHVCSVCVSLCRCGGCVCWWWWVMRSAALVLVWCYWHEKLKTGEMITHWICHCFCVCHGPFFLFTMSCMYSSHHICVSVALISAADECFVSSLLWLWVGLYVCVFVVQDLEKALMYS